MASLYDYAKPDEKVVLKGELVFSSLRKPTKPRKENQYDKDPAYRITIADPEITHGADTDLGKHILDEGITHGIYKSKSGQYAGHNMWSFVTSPVTETKKTRCPAIFAKDAGGDSVPANQFLTNELAPGQEVEVLFSTYLVKAYNKIGGSLDGVRIEDSQNIKYIGEGNNVDYEAEFGKPTGKLKPNPKASEPTKDETKSNDSSAKSSDDNKSQEEKDVDKLFD